MIQKILQTIDRGNRQTLSGIAVMSMLVGASGIAWAAPITVANHSFENPATAGSPTSWTTVGNVGVWRPNVGTQVNSIPDGLQTVYIFGAGSVSQNLGVAAQIGTIYYMDVWVGTQINFTGGSYSVALLEGNTVIASASGTRNQTDPFALISISGTAAGNGSLQVRLSSISGQPLFDNVQVQPDNPIQQGVPEPSTLALIGLGGLCLAWRKRT